MITELTQDWGNRLLEGTSKTLCIPGPRRKDQLEHLEVHGSRTVEAWLGEFGALLCEMSATVW